MRDLTPIAPFVSSLTDRIFAIFGLPEEFIAALIARYSREKEGGLRDLLLKALEEGDIAAARGDTEAFTTAKARAFHEKWVNAYGHGSVAEHATVHLGVEGISLLAAEALLDVRLGAAYTVKSTRYVRFDKHQHLNAQELDIPAALEAEFTAAVEGLLEVYTAVANELRTSIDQEHPGTTESARSGWVFDRARAILPTCVPTSMGVTLNGRAAAHMVRKLLSHDLPEVRLIGLELAKAAGHVLPTLMRHLKAEPGRKGMRARVLAALGHRAESILDNQEASHTSTGSRFDWDDEGLRCAIIAHALGSTGITFRGELDDAKMRTLYHDLLRAYLEERGEHERPGRALETARVRLDVTTNFGAWRDIRRHRTFAMEPPVLHPDSVVTLDHEIEMRGRAETWERLQGALVAARMVARKLRGLDPLKAQYPMPLGTLVHSTIETNVRALIQFIELRSKPEGHDDYRTVAQRWADQLFTAEPLFRDYVRVNRDPRVMARK